MKKIVQKFLFLLSVSFSLLISNSNSYAQTCASTSKLPYQWPSQKNWFFAQNLYSGVIVDMTTGVGTSVGYAGNAVQGYEGNSLASDDNGNLLFYTNGRDLWTPLQTLVGATTFREGDEGGNGKGSATQGCLTVKHPLNYTDYYVFTTDDALSPTYGFNYNVLKKNLITNAITIGTPTTRLGAYRTSETVCATMHANGIDIWISVREGSISGTNGATIYSYLLTCTGLNTTPVVSTVTAYPYVDANLERRGMAFSYDGTKLAAGHGSQVILWDFNNATGAVTNGRLFGSVTAAYDLTFSPDSKRIFASGQSDHIFYFDVTSGVATTINASQTSTGIVTQFSSIEIGPNGSLYYVTGAAAGGNLYQINGAPNTATSFTTTAVAALNGQTSLSIPNMFIPPNEYVKIQPQAALCTTDAAVDLSTLFVCRGTTAEKNPDGVYSGNGITDIYNGTFNPAAGGVVVGKNLITFTRCQAKDTMSIVVKSCCTPPVFTTQPTAKTVCSGTTATFGPVALAASPLSTIVKWQKTTDTTNAALFTDIANTSTSYTTPTTSSADNGTWYRVVSVSSPATCIKNSWWVKLTVTPLATVTLSSAAATASQTLCINTAITNITYAIANATGGTVTGLPAGVTSAFAGGVVIISGTPTASGTFSYTVTATGGCGSPTATGTITVNPLATVTLSSAAATTSQTLCINTAITSITYAITNATGGTVTGLPAGVTGAFAGGVVTISGTPTASGTFSYTVTATGGCGSPTATGTITVTPLATVTLSSAAATTSQTLCINTAITNITYAITNATGGTVTGLPAGVTGAFAGGVVTISGTPTASGTFSYTVTATGGCGSPTATGTITVKPLATVTLSSAAATTSQTLCINTAITSITYTLTNATGGTVTGLPAGVTGAFAGGVVTISGTPTASGTFSYTVTATGGCGSPTATGTITVNPLATVTLSSAAATTSQTLCINSAITNITYAIANATGGTVAGLPAGVTSAFAGGVVTISGTPTASGTFSYTVTATGGCGSPTATGTITVKPLATVTLSSAAATTSQTLCINTAITSITYTLTNATGGTVTGLPAGVTGAFAGGVVTISGTPTASGTFSYTVTATGGCGSPTATGTITVTPLATVTLSSAAATTSQTLCINTAITNITYAITNATGGTVTGLPAGVTGAFAGGVVTISGTPTASGTFNYTVTATGGCGSPTATGTITVTPLATVTLSSAAATTSQTLCINTAITNITYAITNATGGTVTGLPAGVTGAFAGGVVTISGTPTASGTFSYTVTATGGCGSPTATGTITMKPLATVTLSSAAATTSQTLCINTAITSITYAITNATGGTVTGLPAGVTGAFAGGVVTISGTPTASGTFSYTVTATGGCGSPTATGTITVTPLATVTLSSAAATTSQTLCINTAITNITYAITNATGGTVTGLPAGVTGAFAGGVVTISGTPTASGTFSYTVTASGGCGSPTATGTITVNPLATVTLSSAAATTSQTLCINTAITSITYTLTNATGGTVAGLPAGVTGAFAGGVVTISGTPTASGTFSYTVTATGGCGSPTATGTITVNPLATVTLTSAAATTSQTLCTSATFNSITYAVANATGAIVTGLPTGITGTYASGTVTISGTPTVTGTFTYTVAATGGCGSPTATGTITVTPGGTVTLTSATTTTNQTICITSAITNITYAVANVTGAPVTGLPAGVTGTLSGGVVTISGTPTVTGTFNYTVTGTGGCGVPTGTGTIIINPVATVTLTSAASTTSQTLCTNATFNNITYAVTNATAAMVTGLPAGITGTFSGGVLTISGSPTSTGTFIYTVSVTSACGSPTASGTITVTPGATVTLTSAAATTSQTICITKSITNITYAVANATAAPVSGLPAGVTGTLSGGVLTISGTPTATGTFNYTVSGTGGCGSPTATGTIIINPAATVTLTSAAATTSQTLCTNTAITDITYAVTNATGASVAGLPTGVTGTYTAGVVTITGSPTVTGTFNYTVTATGGCGLPAATGTITVTPGATVNLTSAAATTTQTVCINASINNITYSIGNATGGTVSGLPAGVTGTFAASVVTITGTPSVAGTFTYTVTATGGCGSPNATGTITVTPLATVTLTSAGTTTSQAVCVSSAITSITYAVTNATGGTVSGLPTGVTGTYAGGVVTISGTPGTTGTFTYTVTVTGGCGSPTATGTITVNPLTTVTLSSVAGSDGQTICLNSAINNITYAVANGTGVTASGLPAGITGNFSAGVFTISGTATASGTFNYTVNVTGSCGNPSTTGTITVDPCPFKPDFTLSANSCLSATGTASVTVTPKATGTVSGWQWDFAGGTSTQAASSTGPGDALAMNSDQATPPTPFTINFTTPGNKNIILTVDGPLGSTPKSYTLTYVVGDIPAITASANNEICTNTTTNIPLSSANVPTATFTWATPVSNPAGAVTGGAAGGGTTIADKLINTTNAAATLTYTVTATGPAPTSCTNTKTVIVTVDPKPVVTVPADNEVCSAAPAVTRTLSTTVSGATIAWSSVQTDATGSALTGSGTSISEVLTAATVGTVKYTAISTGPAPTSCASDPASFTITVNPLPVITPVTPQTICANTSTTTVTLASSIPLSTYTYTASATSANVSGFSGSTVATTGIPAQTITSTSSATETVSYVITATSTKGCVSAATETFNVKVTPLSTIALTSPAGTDAQSLCVNTALTNIVYTVTGATMASATGLPAGVTGSYASGAFTITGAPTATGTYNYTVTPSGGCGTPAAQGTITVNPTTTLTLTSAASTTSQSKCINTAITNITYSTVNATNATVSGLPTGITANFAGNTLTISGSTATAGTYSYTVSTVGPCGNPTATGTITIVGASSISLSSSAGTDAQTICINTAITNITYSVAGATGATLTGSLPTGLTGSFSGNVYTITGTATQSGSFSYTVATTGGCTSPTAQGTVNVTPNATITLTSGTNNQKLCINTAITNITYTIANATGGNVTGLPAGVTGTFAGSLLTISGTPTISGTFNYTATATGGCTSPTATGTIIVNPIATIGLSSGSGTDAQTICINTGLTPITYSVTNATGVSIASVSPLPAGVKSSYSNGVYTITGTPTQAGSIVYTVTATGGCTSPTATGTITVIAKPVAIIAGGDITQSNFNPVKLNGKPSTPAPGTGISYNWSTSDGGSISANSDQNTATAQLPTTDLVSTYKLTVSADNAGSACSSETSVTITVKVLLDFPNVFSPNDDNNHDFFVVKNSEYFPDGKMEIFNQWGDKIYVKKGGYNANWDGTHNGNPLPVATYYYIYTPNMDGYSPVAGSISILR